MKSPVIEERLTLFRGDRGDRRRRDREKDRDVGEMERARRRREDDEEEYERPVRSKFKYFYIQLIILYSNPECSKSVVIIDLCIIKKSIYNILKSVHTKLNKI